MERILTGPGFSKRLTRELADQLIKAGLIVISNIDDHTIKYHICCGTHFVENLTSVKNTLKKNGLLTRREAQTL